MKLSKLHAPVLIGVLASLIGCTPAPVAVPTTGAQSVQSILAWSSPAAGSAVSAPVNQLMLHFSPPARLMEVTVTGAEGMMPMMVTAVGEVEHYSIPVSGLDPGSYTVDWRAGVRGQQHQGRFSFTVR